MKRQGPIEAAFLRAGYIEQSVYAAILYTGIEEIGSRRFFYPPIYRY